MPSLNWTGMPQFHIWRKLWSIIFLDCRVPWRIRRILLTVLFDIILELANVFPMICNQVILNFNTSKKQSMITEKLLFMFSEITQTGVFSTQSWKLNSSTFLKCILNWWCIYFMWSYRFSYVFFCKGSTLKSTYKGFRLE